VRGFIEKLLEQELTAALGRTRHERAEGEPAGYRNGARKRQLLGSFGPVELSVPRARMAIESGATQEWRSASLPRYARMMRQVEALIGGAYIAGTNTRRVKRALAALFGGAVGARTWSAARGARSERIGMPGASAIWLGGDRGRVARPFGFALTDPGRRLSRTRLFPEVTRIMPHVVSRGE